MQLKDSEKGHTMVEIVLTLGILGAMSVGIATMVSSMHDKYRVSRICQQAEELKKVVNGRYVADGSYTPVSVATLLSEGIAPKDMINGTKLWHKFRGEARVSGTTDTYEVSFYTVPQKACVELGMINWMIDNSSDLITLSINSVTFKWPWAASGADKVLPAEITNIGTACKDSNTITWKFQ